MSDHAVMSNSRPETRRISLLPRKQYLTLVCFGAIAVFWLAMIRDGHRWADDYAMYVQQAINIVEGQPYDETTWLPNPSTKLYAPNATPPVFSLLLVPLYAVVGLNLNALKLVGIVSFLVSLPIIYRLLRSQLSWRASLAVVLLLGFNPFLWELKDDIGSDYSFLFFTYIALFLLVRHYDDGEAYHRLADSPVLIGTILYLACGTRSVGLLLLVCVLLYEIYQNRRLTRFLLVLATTFGVLALLQHIIFPPTGYVAQVDASWAYLLPNAISYFSNLMGFWYNGRSDLLMGILFIVTMTVALVGYARNFRKRRTLLELYAFAYVLSLVVWPMYQGLRYLIPLLPLYLLYVFVGLDHLATLVPRSVARALVVLLFATSLVNYAVRYTTLNLHVVEEGLADPDTQELFAWVRSQTPEDGALVFEKPRALALFTGRQATTLHPPSAGNEVWEYWDEIGADYLIISYFDPDFWRDFARADPDRFTSVFESQDFLVYRVNSSLSDAGPLDVLP